MVGGMSPLVWSDPGSGHDPHGTTPPKGMGYGGGAQEGMRHHGGFSPLALKEQLDLSDAQVNRLRPLEMEYRKSMIKNGADVRVEMVDLGTLMDAKDVDMGAITAKVDENRCVAKEPDDVSCQNPFAGQRGVHFGPI